MNTRPLLMLGTVRGVGKDTLCHSLQSIDHRFSRFSFADPLKNDLDPFLREHYGIGIHACSSAEKETVRPLLIAHGMVKRSLDPDYWVKRTLECIVCALDDNPTMIPIITDGRFENEIKLVRYAFPGTVFVNICRDGAPPPTEEEEKHYRKVAAMADRHLVWGGETSAQQRERAREVMGWLGL